MSGLNISLRFREERAETLKNLTFSSVKSENQGQDQAKMSRSCTKTAEKVQKNASREGFLKVSERGESKGVLIRKLSHPLLSR